MTKKADAPTPESKPKKDYTPGLLPLAIGFFIIMISPTVPGATRADPGLVTLGIAFVLVGFYMMTRKHTKKKPTDASAQSNNKK
ncbi:MULTISPECIES: hypothetical protein [Lacticaseibacillus]|uniref:LPXTG cell wall anchor domain-containing protein n=2 Tax=Lacticaseibacillus TaxID=2759736 RepID=A0ABW4CGG2_9LACO|nr:MULTISPECIES: hypothetical protein [Lacticaseibacillus]